MLRVCCALRSGLFSGLVVGVVCLLGVRGVRVLLLRIWFMLGGLFCAV